MFCYEMSLLVNITSIICFWLCKLESKWNCQKNIFYNNKNLTIMFLVLIKEKFLFDLFRRSRPHGMKMRSLVELKKNSYLIARRSDLLCEYSVCILLSLECIFVWYCLKSSVPLLTVHIWTISVALICNMKHK